MKSILKNKNIFSIIFLLCLIIILSVLNISNYIFLLTSILFHVVLILIIKDIIKRNNILFSKKKIIFLILLIFVIIIIYSISIFTRKFIYYWDFSCYYNLQLDTIKSYQSGLITGIKQLVGSTWAGEYGSLLSYIPQVIFQFTNKSISFYLFSSVITIIPYLIISIGIFTKKILNTKKEYKFIISVLIISLIPLLHGTFIIGQPDLFGLVFIFLLLTITKDYNFIKLDIIKLLEILLLTLLLTMSRRWYVYWILTYYILYIIMILITNKKQWKTIIKNILLYGIIVLIFYLVPLIPFFKNTLLNDYATSYQFYKNGGILEEVIRQIRHIGIIQLIMILGGVIIGWIRKEHRETSIISIIQLLLIIILFNRIQSMGLHHSLLFIPIYSIFIIILIDFIPKKSYLGLISIILLNFIISFTNYTSINFTDVKLIVEDDKNYNQLVKIENFLEKKLSNNNRAYMITHNDTINPDKLRNIKTPNSKVKKYLPYGSAIIGVHKFPIELFTSKYIITTTPYESISVDLKYNNVFKNLVEEKKFKRIKTYQLKDNIKLEIYERIEKVDEEEKEKYKEALKEESKNYKYLYEDIINSYKS